MKFKAIQIAEILEGVVFGDENVEVHKLSKIEEGEEGSLTFLSNPKYTQYIYTTKASIAIVNKDFVPESEIQTTLIKVPDAYKAFSKLLEFYNQAKLNKFGIETPSYIAQSAVVGENIYVGSFAYISNNVKIGDNVKIYPNVYIEDNVTIGDNTIIFAGAKIMSETVIGKNCIINAGCVIGADGFGFAPNEEGVYSKIPQIGNVVIEDNVDIGAATTIDRATLGSTIIRQGVKLDNQIQIGHNVEIGKNTVIAAQTGIAGSSKVGENCMFGGQVGIAGHLIIGNNVRIQAQSGIGRNIKDNEVIQGSPAFGYTDWNKSYVYFKNLPKLANKINDLEKELKAIKTNYE
ncbi:UDP-3-O-(3-hydroxymyristoyl)glucosamine N-acyltransferase [Lutibacter sp. HS1-25]|uniref:UDP-3-O-(3-hydroxymyristoyl)glucosamine N-acyltransferase n=1 Tax=Lutibacter sp. HS1-25 TaxID=2485000 RepID=UPI00101190DA|nr:UDP-3-O-(3-hydroxymyristoyl)glucosamine N-acyltransferase [Lutibacter sp. HS1-25]RXP57081.1 UDP-3-O-(3-hydroxymyristoyl)glucosamine N-acyltransferase [Lutibacter sp. HS1-25]